MGIYRIEWDNYLCSERCNINEKNNKTDVRNAFEKDFGKVVFCPALRRMHDKTQVVPLSSGDSVITRLTHSLQVMNVAESLTYHYTRSKNFRKAYGQKALIYESQISAILRTAAIIHDIGNPPFGHFGEKTIQKYFKNLNEQNHLSDLTENQKLDFTEFDGNAQGLRIISKLQYTGDLYGLNLTYATLGAYLKYPNTDRANKDGYIGMHKHGIFYTENNLFNMVVNKCKLNNNGFIKRHPLAFLVEAADSICYLVMDLEDGYAQKWYTFKIIIDHLNTYINNKLKNEKGRKSKFKIEDFFHLGSQWDKEDSIIANKNILLFREAIIGYLIDLAAKNFQHKLKEIDNGEYNKELIEDDEYYIANALRDFSNKYIITNRLVQRIELTGNSVINGLLSILIKFIMDEKNSSKLKGIFSDARLCVSLHESNLDNPRIGFFDKSDILSFDLNLLSQYEKYRLIVDFITSMTDKYSVELYQKLCGMRI